MLKTRVIGVIIVRNGIAVQSIGFKRYLPVGRPEIAVEYLNRWGIDEIVLLDIDATPESRRPLYDKIKQYSKHCQIPLTIGGGISDVSVMEKVVRSGADKIAVNTAAVKNSKLITDGARMLGSQCVVVSIDVRRSDNNKYEVFTDSGKYGTGFTPVEAAKKAEGAGAGEIFLNSIDRDGSKMGFDTELIQQVTEAINIPVIVCGGANHPKHFLEAMKYNVSAVAAANFFHYSEHSVIITKSYLESANAGIRLDSYANYHGFKFDGKGRAAKIDDSHLEKLRFVYIPEEVI